MTTINFENTAVAFKVRSKRELGRAFLMFKLISRPGLVKLGNSVIGMMARIGLPVNWIVKPTVYAQFCGGETINECAPVVEKLATGQVRSILDYSVEGSESDVEIEKALQETLKAIDFAGKNENIPFAVFKPTAFIKSRALEILSQGEEKADEESKKEGAKFRERVLKMCTKAAGYNLSILIDAEDSWYQNFIDQVVYEMQVKFNKEKAIVFNTYQMYRWDRLDLLKKDVERARKEKYFIGVKFVRGAYMERERARAMEKNYMDPIQKDKESTDKDYNSALEYSLENIDITSIFNGTHNEFSSKLMAEKMLTLGLSASDERCWFSQLYGMSDNISFNLALAGFNVAKYVPYGPVKHVLPYLTRRAEENTSVKGQTGRELKLITAERRRRKKEK
ncbi:MAG: proline dehydrogenase family protein [Bacteroidales bacterium]|nr:proline dehydrogenase family protein [Bacteroidales bacterium]MCF8391172.1 proline dehydrogenase family protein [Bacteroidales bacterium]